MWQCCNSGVEVAPECVCCVCMCVFVCTLQINISNLVKEEGTVNIEDKLDCKGRTDL